MFIRHDNSGVGPSWYLEGVEVTEEGMGQKGERRTTQFPCGQWLEECEGCGGELGVELLPEGSEERRRKTLDGKKRTYFMYSLWDQEEVCLDFRA